MASKETEDLRRKHPKYRGKKNISSPFGGGKRRKKHPRKSLGKEPNELLFPWSHDRMKERGGRGA